VSVLDRLEPEFKLVG